MITHIHICQQLDKPFKIWKSELYCTIAQSLLWKKMYHWPTKLYCDNATYEIFKSLDILEIWDEIDTDLLNQQTNINKTRFWSSGKLLVMNTQTEPYMMSDLDFVNFTDMFRFNFFNGYDLGVYHKEPWFMNSAYAKPKEKLKEVDFKPKQKLNFWANPFNMGSFYMGDMNLNKKYTELSLEYINRASQLESPKFRNNAYTVFAEQQLLAALISESKYKYTCMLAANSKDGGKWFKSNSGFWNLKDSHDYAIHLWLDKYNFKNNPSAECWYIELISNKLEKIAPEIKQFILNKFEIINLECNKQYLIS